MPSRNYRPRAADEVVAGYSTAAHQAAQRQLQSVGSGDGIDAALQHRDAEYCEDMADARALDDDDPGLAAVQRRKGHSTGRRPRREIPMPAEVMDTLAGRLLTGDSDRPLGPWQHAVLELAMGYLSENQRSCLELVTGAGISAKEAGKVLGMAPGEVRQHIARAKRKIRDEIRPIVARCFDSSGRAEEG